MKNAAAAPDATPPKRRTRRLGALLLSLVLLPLLGGCDSLLDVAGDPETVEAGGGLTLTAAMAGMESDFTLAYDIFVLQAGLFTDELVRTHTFCDGWDCRRVFPEDDDIHGVGDVRNNTAEEPVYPQIQTAVAQADQMQVRIEAGEFPELTDGTDSPEYALASLFAGYGKYMVATLYCTVAFGGTGPELSTSEAYHEAIEEFSAAIEASGATSAVRQAARVGRARMNLWLGDEAAALEDAAAVDPGFEFNALYASNPIRQQNRVWFHTWDHRTESIEEPFLFLTIDDTGETDPRTAHSEELPAFSAQASVWAPEKVPTSSSVLRVATGDEAQYLIAEVEGGETAVSIINAVRARHGIDTEWTPDGGDPDEIRDKLIDERRRTLFLDGVRLYDLRRYIDKFGLDFFPTAPHPSNFTMGDQTCAPLPNVERNNNPDI